jgi:ATP/maltotriose-dependent transcriptional regulator MalT
MAKRAKCHLELGDADQAADYARQALATMSPAFPRHKALATVDLARACVRSGEVAEGAHLLGNAGEIAGRHSSTRLITRVQQARAELQPWQDTRAVRELDERLTTYGLLA